MTPVGIWATTCPTCWRVIYVTGPMRDWDRAILCIDCAEEDA